MHNRAQNLLVFALQRTGTQLEDFRITSNALDEFRSIFLPCPGCDKTYPPESNGQLVNMQHYRGPALPILWFQQWSPVIDNFTNALLRPLRRLCLTIDPGDSTDYFQKENGSHANMIHALEFAANLEVLELRSVNTSYFNFPNFMLRDSENSFKSNPLKKLVLDNFIIEKREFEEEMLPWCFDNKTHTLQLQTCILVGTNEMSARSFWHYLVGKDVRFGSGNDTSVADVEEGDHTDEVGLSRTTDVNKWPYDNDDRTSFYSDDSDYDGWEYTYEYRDAPRVPFVDIDFGLEQSDSEHDDERSEFHDDHEYIPWTREMWNQHLDSPIPNPHTAYSTFHRARVAAYDEEYRDDTAGMDVTDEFPVPRLTLREAPSAFGFNGADVELMFCEKDWGLGTGEHVLKLWIDDFKYIPD